MNSSLISIIPKVYVDNEIIIPKLIMSGMLSEIYEEISIKLILNGLKEFLALIKMNSVNRI